MEVMLGANRVVIDADDNGPFVHTTLSDGTTVQARPVDESWEQTRLHDLMHTIVAYVRGEDHSPALWNVAHRRHDHDVDEVAHEEALVLELVRIVNLAVGSGTRART